MNSTENIDNKIDLDNIQPRDLLDAGIHFGHEKTKWNPKMKSYIHSSRKGVHVINIFKTLEVLKEVSKFVKKLSANGGTVFMLGTKKQSQQTIKAAAMESNSHYVISRWLGGTLTNHQTILSRIKYLASLENEQKNTDSSSLTKKELTLISKKINKLNKFFEGMKNYKKLPDCLFVVDVKKEKIAINEANILKIPVIAHGGAGNFEHMRDAFLKSNVSALACGTLFNFGDNNPIRAKAFLKNYDIPFKRI